MLLAVPAHATLIKGYVLIDGKEVPAEYTLLGNNCVSVGSGKNACISQYTKGFLTIPGEITVNSHTYTVTEVNSVAFRLCSQLTGVEIRENVKRVGNFAFVGCEALREIILPASMEKLGSGAFVNTVSKQSASTVTCLGTTPPVWEYNDVFCMHEYGIGDPNPVILPATVEIYVPEECDETYRDANYTNSEIGWNGPDGWGSFSTLHTGVQTVHVYRPADLMIVREIVNNGKYNFYNCVELEDDIDMTGVVWDWGIGNNEEHPFEGSFLGNGHTISNLTVHNPDGPAGLFSYFGGHTIENLIMKNFDIQGKTGVGAFAGVSGSALITSLWADSCKYSVNNGSVGGLFGKFMTTGGASVYHCVVNEPRIVGGYYTNPDDYGLGGLVGSCFGARIENCAVIGDNLRFAEIVKPFVGFCGENDLVQVSNSYATDEDFANYTPADNVIYSNVVLYGKTCNITKADGSSDVAIIDADNFKTLLMLPTLGLFDWIYQDGYYPLPMSFESKMPVLVNCASYIPGSRNSTRVNALRLGASTPWNCFYDMSENGYRGKLYLAYRLWIDDNFPYNPSSVSPDKPSLYLPISTATIRCSNGVDYDRVLDVTQTGTEAFTVPTAIVDDEGNFILDEDGHVQLDGNEVTLYETPVFAPTAHSVYLPYQLNHNYTFRLYEPSNLVVSGHDAILEMDEIDAETINAWTPYYLVVNDVPVDLSTEETLTIYPEPETNHYTIDNYHLHGTVNPKDPEAGMFVMDALDTFVPATEQLPSWRAYFDVPQGIDNLSVNREIRLYDDENNYMTIADFDGVTVTATLRGRTFHHDNTWQTLTLPFDVSGIDMGPLNGATICDFRDASVGDDGSLALNFHKSNYIEAGKPYLVKWADGEDVVNPKFHNVTIKDEVEGVSVSGNMFMVGFYVPVTLDYENTVLYLGANNRLYKAESGMNINAFRACFFYLGDENLDQFTSIRLNVMSDVMTDVEEVNVTRAEDPNWYTIDGRVLKSRPSEPGIYINNGKKIIVK